MNLGGGKALFTFLCSYMFVVPVKSVIKSKISDKKTKISDKKTKISDKKRNRPVSVKKANFTPHLQ